MAYTTYEKLCIIGNSFLTDLNEEMANNPDSFVFKGIGTIQSVESYQLESVLDCETETEIEEHNTEAITLIETWLLCIGNPRYELLDKVIADIQKSDIKEGIDVCLVVTETNETKLCVFGYALAKETTQLIYTL